VISKGPLFLVAASLGLACTSERPPAQPLFAEMPRGSPLHFRYELADGKGVLAPELFRGRPLVIVFLTTYDLASQAQARFLSGIARRHGPSLHAAAVMLEPIENRPLVVAFRDALKLDYPVALGDASLIAGEGPFGDVRAVPSTIVLDSEGRVAWSRVGLSKEEEIENVLRGL
jgi:hypothetical protein